MTGPVQDLRQKAIDLEAEADTPDEWHNASLAWADVMQAEDEAGGVPFVYVADFERCSRRARRLA